MEYITNAPKGAELLTSRKPGWFRGFLLVSFNINDPWWCVLGQVFGSYRKGKRELWGDLPEGELYRLSQAHGFVGQSSFDDDQLNAEWVQIITDLHRPGSAFILPAGARRL